MFQCLPIAKCQKPSLVKKKTKKLQLMDDTERYSNYLDNLDNVILGFTAKVNIIMFVSDRYANKLFKDAQEM